MELRTANVTRYIMPLREGGSLPALAEADDEFKYVVKFRGAGHGTKALIAELIGGEIARCLGFHVPELVFLNLDEAFGRSEGDEEIQDLLQASQGLNLGLHFLSGALTFDLREGGSLPALAEADDEFKYVVKFRGAGHGTKALIAELIGGEIARCLGFHVPELVFLNLDEAFGRSEGDEEIQDLLQASQGLNLGLHFLSGALTFDPVVNRVDPKLASQVVWLDALLTNIDRTVRNTNMLIWNKELWLIDHGASLFFHFSWVNWQKHAIGPFIHIKDHVLLPQATLLEEVNKDFKRILTEEKIREIVGLVPDDWLHWNDSPGTPQEIRDVYIRFLIDRIAHSDTFINEARHARQTLI